MGKLQEMILNDGIGRKITAVTEIVLGNVLFGLVVKLFLLPASLVTSGATGISIVLYEISGIPVSYSLLVLNVLMLFVGLLLLGRAFALSTLLSTFISPLALGFCGTWHWHFSRNRAARGFLDRRHGHSAACTE